MLHSRHMNLFKRGVLIVIGILLIAFAMSESSQAAFVDPIDQTSDTENTIPTSQGGSKGVGQSFTAGKTGWMYDVDVFLGQYAATEREISLTIHEGADINGTVLGVAKVSSSIVPVLPGGWVRFNFNEGIYVESNKMYGMMMETTNNEPNQMNQVTWRIYEPSVYTGGTPYYYGSWNISHFDFAFRTYVASQQRDYSTSLQLDQLTTTYGNTEEIRATLLDVQNQAVSNKRVTFSLDGNVLGSSNTNGNGEAIFSYSVNTAIGDHTLTAEFAGGPIHFASSDSVMMRVDKRPLAVTADDATREYGTSNPVFTGTITGGLSSDGITATYATSADQTSDVGNYAIEAALVDPNNKLGNYEITKTAGSLSVTKASLTVTADNATREYGTSNPVFTGTVVGGFSSDGITATYATSADQTSDVGNYAIEATLNDPNNKLQNYEVTKTLGSLSVTKASLAVTADDATREYGTSNSVFTGTIVGSLSSDGITATYATSADQASHVGSYAIEATLNVPNNKLGNYEVTKTAGSLSVTKASLSVTADDATREYGTSNSVFTGTIVGSLSSDGITATYATNANQASNVGNYAIEATLNDPNNKLGNYEVTKTAGSLSVTKASLSVTADDATREYGTSNPVFAGTLVGGLSSDVITATYATNANQASNVGNYAIEATLNDPNNKIGNYEVTKTAGSLSVTKASLSVTANDATREYGMSNPVFTGTITGGLSSDGLIATYATSADQASNVGNYAIEVTLNDPNNKLGNYEVTKTAGSLSVTKAPITVTPNSISRWVNNANPFLDGVVTGVLNNDDISVKYVTLAEQSSPIGNYTIETEIIDPNQRLGNYEVTSNTAMLNVYDVPKITYATNDTASSVIGSLGLPATDDEGRSIQWVSSNNQFVDGATGYVQRPSYTEGNKSTTLKATITADGATYEAIYPLIIIANSNTSSGVFYYIEVISANGKQRVELKLDDLKKGFVTIKSDSEVAEFMISKATLTQLKAILPSMKLQFMTVKDEMTIPIQEMAIAGDNHDLTIKIGRADTKTEFVEVKRSLGANVLAGPVVFNVNQLDDQGRSSEISAFTAYVERRIELNGQESDFATVVFWDEEKQAFTFVPAKFINENGKGTAIVKSMRNGYFFVIDRRVSFVDLQNHWAKSDIELLAAKFIIQGRSEMNFDPNGMLTRAETAALLVRAIGIPLNNTEFSFSDVDGKWYEADVIAAEQAGLIKGYSDGTFRPNNRVTREELAVMLTRAIAYANPSLQTANRELALADVESISSWAEDSIYQALSLGIIKGDQQGNFKPQAEATRAEMVTLLSRMLKLLNFI
jgi:hypothetical protein